MNDANNHNRNISPILHTVAWLAVPLIVLMSIIVFMQGHNLPGGGFIAGVLVAAAGGLYLMAFGSERAGRVAWWKFAVFGLIISLITGVVPAMLGHGFMNHTVWHWHHVPIIGEYELPSATFFDLGVYLIVFGTLMTIFVELAQEEH